MKPAKRASRKLLAVLVSIVLAVGLMPAPLSLAAEGGAESTPPRVI